MENQTEFKYKIEKDIAVLSTSENGRYTVELKLISFNDKPAKYDVRKWDTQTGRMFKGISLTADELKALVEAVKGEV